MSVSLPLSLWLVAAGCSSSESAVGSTTTGSSTSPPLSISILEPAAGAHVAEGMVQVEGTQVGLTSVTLNGEPIDASSGTFSRELEVVRGINTIEARGEKGTTFRLTRRAVLAGTFVEPLGLDGLFVGVPDHALDRCADLLPSVVTRGDPEVANRIVGFVVLYLLLCLAGALALALTGIDPLTAIGGSIASVGNVGPSFALPCSAVCRRRPCPVGPRRCCALAPSLTRTPRS